MSNFTDEFIKIFKVIPNFDKYSTVTVGKEFEEYIAEILEESFLRVLFLYLKKYEIGLRNLMLVINGALNH